MDQNVLDSLKKWPNVPNCFGWLAIDRRGHWRMRNEFAQTHQLPGDVIKHVALKEFIERNYARDHEGRFFFQNGPQRVFVSIDYTPWVVRLIPDEENQWLLKTTIGQSIRPITALLDENGQVLFESDFEVIGIADDSSQNFEKTTIRGVALLHDHDLAIFSELAQMTQNACSIHGIMHWHNQEVPIDQVLSQDLPQQFKYIKIPKAIPV